MIKGIKLGALGFELDENKAFPLTIILPIGSKYEAAGLDTYSLERLRDFLGADSLDPEEAELIRKHRADKAAREAATKRYARIKELEAELAKLRAEEKPRASHSRCLNCGVLVAYGCRCAP